LAWLGRVTLLPLFVGVAPNNEEKTLMTFIAFEVALKLVRSLNPVIAVLMKVDPEMADQLRRARLSVTNNLMEGRRRQGKDRMHFWRTAAASASEIVSTLLSAEASEYVTKELIKEPLGYADEVLAMTWVMTH
jgi:four helix bundle protein